MTQVILVPNEQFDCSGWNCNMFNLVGCRECGEDFNLAAQLYYDNICPDCRDE